MTNRWEKVNVSATVAGVIVAVIGIPIAIATMWEQEVRCLVNSSGDDCSKNIFCMKNTRTQAGSSEVYDTGWKCVKESQDSDWLELGDDNLWQSYLKFRSENHFKSPSTKICSIYRRYSPDSKSGIDANKCSGSSSNYSNEIKLGDDTGWINQELSFTISSSKSYEICLDLIKQEKREDQTKGRRIETGWICNSENPDNFIDLGDDRKYYNQMLRFRIGRL